MSNCGFGLTQGQVIGAGGVEVTSATQIPLFSTFEQLSNWLDLSTKMFICSGDQLSTCAFPDGVLINKEEIETLCKKSDGKSGLDVDRGSVAVYAIAHEMAHLLQAKSWSRSWSQMSHDSFVRELQADYIAGVWIGANLAGKDYNFIDIANIAFGIGNPGWPNGTYPAPEQRQAAVNRGVAGAAWLDNLIRSGSLQTGAKPLKEGIDIAEFERQSRKIAQEIHGR